MPRVKGLRERVTLQLKASTPDGYGGSTVSWTDIATVWARVEPMKGREEVAALRVEGRTLYQVWIRWRAGVTQALRLQWDDAGTTRTFNIRAVVNLDERQRYLRLDCEEGVPD